ncbi:methylated-DNA--[protein]-cysteine S-methyltransferase [Bacillus massiliglaciei]|uniref:methylated-DNA--[protein]-cysteine S-methyltransferase n=1 Tax=Bacillus massiliglaciei TaxID=1816693 RepID=UPI000A9D0D1A|nr:methylated-DNA--[protein]-cysteine S-methyltransferase [Bacillus massiliglaciei]
MKRFTLDYDSPIGVIEITGTEEVIHSILFTEAEKSVHMIKEDTPEVMQMCYRELDAYFKGELQAFTFPYELTGTSFQKSVWNALPSIPYAKTGSYKDIAAAVGNVKAIRAVGSANGKNQLSIVLPCHRIIGSNGKLTGYAGGLWRKEWLLQHEKKMQERWSKSLTD